MTLKSINQPMSATMSRLIILFFLLAIVAVGALTLPSFRQKNLTSRTLPPLGERQYLLPNDRRFDGVSIERLNQGDAARYMRDPDQLAKSASVKAKSSVDHAVPALPKTSSPIPRERSAELRFRRVKVSGRATRPRLDFNLDSLPIERADEPMSQDFYPRVFVPAQDYSF
jgi:hypothetical protein